MVNVSWTCATFLVLLVAERQSTAVELFEHNQIAEVEKQIPNQPICGLLALGAAANALELNVTASQWLDEKYLSSSDGSSAQDLTRAAFDLGLRSRAYERLSLPDLREATGPVLLHVRAGGLTAKFDHWITFLGIQDNEYRIFDARSGIIHCSATQLLLQWDGIGIMIAKQSNLATIVPLLNGWATRFGLWLVCAWLLILCRMVFPSSELLNLQSALAGAVLITTVSVVVGVIWHQTSESGFLKNRTAVVHARRVALPSKEFAGISLSELQRLVIGPSKDTTILLVDARFARDYDRGTIPGAINLPIDSSPYYVGQLVKELAITTPVVVFCQSEHCKYSDIVAESIAAFGFSDVRIFRGGWRNWSKLNTAQHTPNKQS